MKNILKYIAAAAILMAVCATAADVNRLGPIPNYTYAAVNTASSVNTNVAASYATNGLYPLSIAATIPVTNHVVIPQVGKDLCMTLTAGAVGGASTCVFTFQATCVPPSLSYNNGTSASYGWGGYTNSQPMTPFTTVTLATTGTGIQSTNVWYSSSSTPVLGALPYVILEKVTAGASYPATNIAVWVNTR